MIEFKRLACAGMLQPILKSSESIGDLAIPIGAKQPRHGHNISYRWDVFFLFWPDGGA